MAWQEISVCPFLSLGLLDAVLWDGFVLVLLSPAALSPGTCREGRAGPGAAPQADGSAASLTHGFPPATSFNESSKVMSLI